MVEIRKLLDTYALIEIAKQNVKFSEYLNSNFAITDITLAEFYFVLLREDGENFADYWFKKLERYSLQVSKELLKEAIKFKYENRKQNISFFDAVDYIFSVKNGYYFVTGDKEFENMKNVEFKKK
mgnify:CR=1 FL=1